MAIVNSGIGSASSQFIHEVTHALEEVMALCDRVVMLEVDRVMGLGRPEDWFEPECTEPVRGSAQ